MTNIHWSRKSALKALPELILRPSRDYDIVIRAIDKNGAPFAAMDLSLQEVHDAIFPEESI